MTVYLVVSRDINTKTHELYSEGFSIYYSKHDAEKEAKTLREIFDQVDIYESEVR